MDGTHLNGSLLRVGNQGWHLSSEMHLCGLIGALLRRVVACADGFEGVSGSIWEGSLQIGRCDVDNAEGENGFALTLGSPVANTRSSMSVFAEATKFKPHFYPPN